MEWKSDPKEKDRNQRRAVLGGDSKCTFLGRKVEQRVCGDYIKFHWN